MIVAQSIPVKYPPEIPAIIAGKIRHSVGVESFDIGLLLGKSFPREITSILNSRSNTLEIEKETEQFGFFVFNRNEKSPIPCFSCFECEYENAIELFATALHAFRHLNVKRVLLIDTVNPLVEIQDEMVRIDDYINMSGLNPLDYWMLPSGPEEFFLDPKDLFLKDGLRNFRGVTHLCANPELSDEIIVNAVKAGAETKSGFLVTESLISGYLGMRPSALAIINKNGIKVENIKNILNFIDES